jgi:hypothetical protein
VVRKLCRPLASRGSAPCGSPEHSIHPVCAGWLSSYWLFAIGWVAFGVASLRARVFPVWISIFLVVGGIAGYQALLAPWGIPLGLALATLGVWLLRRPRSSATTESLDERARLA